MSRQDRHSWFTQQLRRGLAQRPTSSLVTSSYAKRLRIEALEDRRMLAVVTVDTDQDVVDFDDGVTSLREAIFATNLVGGADEIVFDFGHDGPATILLTEGELEITDDLTITGAGAELLTIDASGNDPTPEEKNGDGSRIFNINDGDDTRQRDVTIHGLTLTGGDIRGGQTSGGGAIFSIEALTLTASAVRDNSARFGGGVLLIGRGNSSITIRETEFESNLAGEGGGLLFWLEDTSRLELTSSTLADNEAGDEGGAVLGLLADESQANFDANAVLNNIGDSGGGMFVQGSDRSQVTITSSTITGNQTADDDFLHFGGGINATVVDHAQLIIEGNTIEDNVGYLTGGGMTTYADGEAVVTIQDNSISRNNSELGGGVFASFGFETKATISGNTIADNMGGQGGGINVVGPVDVVANTISGNTSLIGGGVFSYLPGRSSEFVIEGNVISGNHASSFGGGIAISHGLSNDGTNVRIQRNTIAENIAELGGAGLSADLAENDVLAIVESTFSDNSAQRGGAISILGSDSADLIIDSSTISGNRATEGGGLLLRMFDSTSAEIRSSTISGNEANQRGGGLFAELVEGGVIQVAHSTVTGNIADADSDGDGFGGGILLTNGSLELDHTIVAGNQDNSGVVNDVAGVISSRFSLVGFGAEFLGPLAENGGPTATHALLPGSPAIDAGDPNPTDVPDFDQRGAPFVRIAGERIDIGAYEAPVAAAADFDADGDVDGSDFLAWQRGFGPQNAARAQGNSDDDTDVDASDLAAWSVSYGQSQGVAVAVASAQASAGSESPVEAAIAFAISETELASPSESVSRPMAVDSVFASTEATNDIFITTNKAVESLTLKSTDTAAAEPSQPWLEAELLTRVIV